MRMPTNLLVLVALHMAVAETSDAPFELVLGLPLQRLDQLEKKFWAIADPGSDDYLQHMSIVEVRELIGASAVDVAAAKSWLRTLGAAQCVVSALGDTVVGVFKGERVARASGHWHHWVANPDGVRLPTKTNHTHPLQSVCSHATAHPTQPNDTNPQQPIPNLVRPHYNIPNHPKQHQTGPEQAKPHQPEPIPNKQH